MIGLKLFYTYLNLLGFEKKPAIKSRILGIKISITSLKKMRIVTLLPIIVSFEIRSAQECFEKEFIEYFGKGSIKISTNIS